MSLIFEPEKHTYTSIDPNDTTKWISVTSLVSNFKQPFNGKEVAIKVTKNKKSKWYGISPEDIQDIWKSESDRACDLGNWYHAQREHDLLACETLGRHGEVLPIISPIYDGEKKLASSQFLEDGIYPEHLVYLKSSGICGQSDLVEICNGEVHIVDYKTNKEIKIESFKNWEGISQKMSHPLAHLDDCNLNHYNIQLSLYMYMILKHNPKLKPGTLTIHHVIFEEEDQKDKYGYPITKRLLDGSPVVKEIIQYDLPYLKDEVLSLLSWLKDNRYKLKTK